jgi:lysylphosphatidylglycerol synthetase-like protein (DUF2156 family)
MNKITAFFAFWYDFIVGDDWRVAAGIAAALALTYGVSRSTAQDWWIVPIAVVLLLPFSLWRAVRASRR